MFLPEGKYYNKELKVIVNKGDAQVIEVGEGMKFDRDTIYIKRIINTKDSSYLRYSLIRLEAGWTFSEGALKVYDDRGKEYKHWGGGSSGKIWGQEGLIEIEKIDSGAKFLIIKLDWYDRKNEIQISLKREGEIDEN